MTIKPQLAPYIANFILLVACLGAAVTLSWVAGVLLSLPDVRGIDLAWRLGLLTLTAGLFTCATIAIVLNIVFKPDLART